MWNNYKIRIVFLISLKKEDMREIFYLQNTIFHHCFDPEILKHLKTVREIISYFEENEEPSGRCDRGDGSFVSFCLQQEPG